MPRLPEQPLQNQGSREPEDLGDGDDGHNGLDCDVDDKDISTAQFAPPLYCKL